jgi:hypothetical protein
VQRISARIRGDEIAQYIGAKLNPTDGYENDVCIYVKPKSLDPIKDGAWIDYLDGKNLWITLKDRPDINVIAATDSSYYDLRSKIPNHIELIPSHHLNFDRIQSQKNKILTGGYIGSPSPTAFKMYDEIKKNLKNIGVDFRTCFNFKIRQDAIDLYSNIDFLVIGNYVKENDPHKVPTKLINAGSFGIPSIAYPLKGYEEIEGAYLQAHDMADILIQTEKLKDLSFYDLWANKAKTMAEKYHICNIAQLYKKLT